MAEATSAQRIAAPPASKLPLVIAVVVALAAGAGGGMFFASKRAQPAAEAAAHEPAAEPAAAEGEHGATAAAGQIVPLEPFLVNLVTDESPRYLKVKVELELDSAGTKARLDESLPKVRDAVIALLSSRRVEDVAGFEGKALLKQEIAERINGVLAKGRVTMVMFTDFVVQ